MISKVSSDNFLDAPPHLNKRMCPFVDPSVGPERLLSNALTQCFMPFIRPRFAQMSRVSFVLWFVLFMEKEFTQQWLEWFVPCPVFLSVHLCQATSSPLYARKSRLKLCLYSSCLQPQLRILNVYLFSTLYPDSDWSRIIRSAKFNEPRSLKSWFVFFPNHLDKQARAFANKLKQVCFFCRFPRQLHW